jgi:glycosyltransferase involved in cell wall biosynthesis
MWKALSFAARVGRLTKTLHRFRPHVLHAFLPERTLFMSATAEALHPVPLFIANRRSSVSVYRKSGWKTALERLALMRVDAMLTNSEALREEVIRVDGFKDVAMTHGGTDTELFHPGAPSGLRREMGWTSEHIVAGMVANFRACKRHEDFVSAAKALHDRHPQMRFVLMGNDRGTLGAVRRQIADFGLTEVFKIINGSLEPESVYPALDMYVCASESEGFPNAVLEAMACGKPVIATRVGGTAEAMDDAVEGLLIPPHDPGAIAAAAERLIGDAELGRRLGAAARARVQVRYSLATMVAAHEAFYLEQLQRLDYFRCPETVDANE